MIFDVAAGSPFGPALVLSAAAGFIVRVDARRSGTCPPSGIFSQPPESPRPGSLRALRIAPGPSRSPPGAAPGVGVPEVPASAGVELRSGPGSWRGKHFRANQQQLRRGALFAP